MGASSDHLMIDLKEEINFKVGDCIPFSLEYEALSQLMYHQRMEKYYSEEHTISQRINNLNQSKIYQQQITHYIESETSIVSQISLCVDVGSQRFRDGPTNSK